MQFMLNYNRVFYVCQNGAKRRAQPGRPRDQLTVRDSSILPLRYECTDLYFIIIFYYNILLLYFVFISYVNSNQVLAIFGY